MGFFDINYNQKAVELLPPAKRGNKMVAWVKALLSQVQYCRDKILGDYKVGSDYSTWAAGTYTIGNRVIYGQSVYEVIVGSTTSTPTTVSDWRIYLAYFVGVDERILYNHIKLTLEYALNKRFGTTFNQPPTQSDIYIDTNTPNTNVFIVGANEDESSIVYSGNSNEVVINSYSFATFNNYTINIPTSVYNSLGSNDAERESTVRNFANKYNTIGLNYNIATY
jgi:hypothetical protein